MDYEEIDLKPTDEQRALAQQLIDEQLAAWAARGIASLERYLAIHAAFADYRDTDDDRLVA